jgi:hypothetical protein
MPSKRAKFSTLMICFAPIFSNLPLPFSGITFFGIEGCPFFWCYLCCLFTCFGHDLIIFMRVCMTTRVNEPADGNFYSLTVSWIVNSTYNNILKKEIPMYVKLYFSDITKDPENQPPRRNQADWIIYGYKHLLLFATTGSQHHCPLIEALPPSLPPSAIVFFAPPSAAAIAIILLLC